MIYTKFQFLLFLKAWVLILVGHKNNFDYKDDRTPQAKAKGKKSENENSQRGGLVVLCFFNHFLQSSINTLLYHLWVTGQKKNCQVHEQLFNTFCYKRAKSVYQKISGLAGSQ